MTARDIDPITLEVVCEALIAIVREMRATVVRTAYSAAVYELDDFSCALFAPNAELVAQWNDLPSHVIPMPWGVKCAMDDFKGEIDPGDIILLNDSYRGGTHLNDVTVMYPVFNDEELIIFPVVRAHWADVGGMVPGSYSGEAVSIFQEGMRIPPIKLYERGRVNRAAMDLILSNMRIPSERLGDLNSAIGACRIAETRIRKLIAKYGIETVLACIKLDLDRSEQRLRNRIRALPDGDYYYEDYLEYYDGDVLDPVLMRLKLTVRGDEIVADFAGSNAQVPGPVNTSLAVAGAGIFVAVKATLDPGGTVNGGLFRPLKFSAPEATIVDVRPDAPAGAHAEVRKRCVSVALGALSQIIPESVSGDLCGTSFPNNMGGYNSRRQRDYVYIEVPAGGNGGFMEHDGSSAFVNVDHGNVRSIQTAECLESEIPFVVERCELRLDSAGDGRRRGGLGMRRELRLVDDEATYSVLSDRAVIPPYGVLGGYGSAQVKASILRDGVERQFPKPGKVSGYKLKREDVVIMQSAGGGGYGDPLERELELVARDVAAGYISRQRARERYGVVFSQDGSPDVAATAVQRSKLAAQQLTLTTALDERDPYEGRKGRHRVLRMTQALADQLNVVRDQLVELRGANPAPLRAWVVIDHTAASSRDRIALDTFGHRVLGITPGSAVTLRRLDTPTVAGGLSGSGAQARLASAKREQVEKVPG